MAARVIAAMLAVAMSGITGVAAESPAVAASVSPGTTIASLPISTCVDVSTAAVPGFYGYVYGATCTGSSAQTFQFHALSVGPVGTYQVTNSSNGQCLVQYQTGVRLHTCSGSVPPDALNTAWTLIGVGTTGHDYRFMVTSTAATPSPQCLQIYPKPRSHPGPVLLLQACDTTQPTQVLTLTAAP